jgi:D-alanine transfer protein
MIAESDPMSGEWFFTGDALASHVPSTSVSLQPPLRAALITTVIVVVIMIVLPRALDLLPKGGLEALISEHSTQKDMGVILQQRAFERSDVLPVYGSSELTKKEPNKADDFFRSSPDGFQICPVGQAGNTTLLSALKIASVGSAAMNKKVVLLLSASWFRRDAVPADHYAGNFSPMQAVNAMANIHLSKGVRQRLATRLLDYPGTLDGQPLLHSIARQVAGRTTSLEITARLHRPLEWLESTLMRLEDQVGTMMSVVQRYPSARLAPEAKNAALDWEALSAKAALAPYSHLDLIPRKKPLKNAEENQESFINGFAHSREWEDFDLLMSVLAELKMQALVIMIPFDGAFEDAHGVTLEQRESFYHRAAEITAHHGCRLEHFASHDQDPDFVVQHSSHLSGKGWIYVNRMMDDFYHDRIDTRIPTRS